jgi:rhodanese-related sulfurtransferase
MRSTLPHAVLDIRERATYEKGHIYRATSMPRRLLESRLPVLVPARDIPVVLYDADGTLAALALPTLAAMGYRDVRVLGGGIEAWRSSGRRLVQGLNVPSKVFGERALHDLKTPQIAPHALQARIDAGDDMVIVDSRTVEEYTRGCIPGAISVPGGELVLRLPELVHSPTTTIVVHCGGRTRSYIGAESVRRMRLPNPVIALENGTMGWELAGLTLERNAERRPPPVTPRSRAAATLVAKRVAAEDNVRFISPGDLQALLAAVGDNNVYVLDVRTREEYAGGHVAGAVWAPGGQAVQATDEYIAVRAAPVVLVCDGLARSVMTAAWLQRMGLPDVAVLAGGLPA